MNSLKKKSVHFLVKPLKFIFSRTMYLVLVNLNYFDEPHTPQLLKAC